MRVYESNPITYFTQRQDGWFVDSDNYLTLEQHGHDLVSLNTYESN